jgi:hypothetical protein
VKLSCGDDGGNGKCMQNFVGTLFESDYSEDRKEWKDNIKIDMREM